ncbi:unnamed protein product [Ectocarpus sp. 12 AP-2014]
MVHVRTGGVSVAAQVVHAVVFPVATRVGVVTWADMHHRHFCFSLALAAAVVVVVVVLAGSVVKVQSTKFFERFTGRSVARARRAAAITVGRTPAVAVVVAVAVAVRRRTPRRGAARPTHHASTAAVVVVATASRATVVLVRRTTQPTSRPAPPNLFALNEPELD